MKKSIFIIGLMFTLGCTGGVHAFDLEDLFKARDAVEGQEAKSKGATVSGLSENEMVGGLKDALGSGVRFAIAQLGKQNGFLDNARVRIPLPGVLNQAERTLRTLGQERYVDEFVATMNHAAEAAVGEAGPIFAASIRSMTVIDAKDILLGPDDAATQYFRRTTHDALTAKMLPITRSATTRAGVTAAYKSLTDKLGFARGLLPGDALDLDQYITGKALDGLFTMVAEQERAIRQNPVARTTDLLKKVFATVGK